MSLGAGALKVKGPVAQKGSVALEVGTQHSHTEEKFSGIFTTTHTYLSRRREEQEQNRQLSQSVNSNDLQWSQSKAKKSKAEICQHMLALEECKATPHKPAFLGLNCWPESIVSRLTLPKLQFSHITSSILCLKL